MAAAEAATSQPSPAQRRSYPLTRSGECGRRQGSAGHHVLFEVIARVSVVGCLVERPTSPRVLPTGGLGETVNVCASRKPGTASMTSTELSVIGEGASAPSPSPPG